MALTCALAASAMIVTVLGAAPAASASSSGAMTGSPSAAAAQGPTHMPHHAHKPRPKPRPKPKPVWSPRDSTLFNYPFAKHITDRYRIRNHILLAIRYAPRGSAIRFATFTFVDKKVTTALIAAHRRGVSVQVLVNRRDVKLSPPYHRLQKALGHSRHGRPRTSPERASFVRTCKHSCRGTRGNLHSKIYLFSRVGHRRWVSMVGSANLTKFAAVGQWNHLNTITGRRTYQKLRYVFDQMRRDRPMRRPFLRFSTPKTVTFVYPRPHTTALNDPMMLILKRISCRATPYTGVAVRTRPVARPVTKPRKDAARQHTHAKRHRPHTRPITRRTVIRIAMYAWFDKRGDDLARAVRQKWNQGCDVRIIYSVLNRKVKRILYDPAGRGRIPMRRTVTTSAEGKVVDYDHSKYVAVNGRYVGHGHQMVWAGSMNFTHLGLTSDDIVMRLRGRKVYRAYLANFRKVWHAPHSHRPAG